MELLKYRTIVADPPWAYKQSRIVTSSKTAKTHPAASAQYATMSVDEVCRMDVPAADDAHLYLWATNPLLPEIFRVPEAWGFEYRTLLTWVKTGTLGLGFYFRSMTEHVVFATRGKCPILPERRERNIIGAPRGPHSAKPDAFYDMVERVSPAPRLEMFARRARLSGWDYWGDQSLTTANLARVTK